jgi:hypothetical protein
METKEKFKAQELVFYPRKNIYVVVINSMIIVKNSDACVYKCLFPSDVIDLITSFSLTSIKNEQ